jgi:hypothetical protein
MSNHDVKSEQIFDTFDKCYQPSSRQMIQTADV